MPGPVSDSYDPEFSTASNAEDVREAIHETLNIIEDELKLGTRKEIVSVARGALGKKKSLSMPEKYWRMVRFCLYRALEDV